MTSAERAERGLSKAVDAALARYRAMTPEQQAAMWEAQRESWVRGMLPCEHGDFDWETGPHCRAALSRMENRDEG